MANYSGVGALVLSQCSEEEYDAFVLFYKHQLNRLAIGLKKHHTGFVANDAAYRELQGLSKQTQPGMVMRQDTAGRLWLPEALNHVMEKVWMFLPTGKILFGAETKEWKRVDGNEVTDEEQSLFMAHVAILAEPEFRKAIRKAVYSWPDDTIKWYETSTGIEGYDTLHSLSTRSSGTHQSLLLVWCPSTIPTTTPTSMRTTTLTPSTNSRGWRKTST